MALSRWTTVRGGELLAGLRRRSVDDAARHHLSSVRVHAGAVLPVAGGDGQGRGARQAQPADRGIDQSLGAGAHAEERRRNQDFDPDRDARHRRAGAEAAQGRGRPRARSTPTPRSGRPPRPARSTAEADFGSGAGPGRRAQPADRRAAQAARRDRGRARRLGGRQQGIAVEDRRSRASGSMSRWRRKFRSSTATAPTFSAACGRSWARGRTSGWSATGSCSNPRCCSTSARPTSARPASSRSTRSLPPILDLEREIPPDIPWILRVDGHTDNRPIDRRRPVQVELGAVGRARRLGGAISDQQGGRARPAGRGRLRRIPADRPGNGRGVARPQSAHRAQADGAVSASTPPARLRRGRSGGADRSLGRRLARTGFAIDFDARREWLANHLRTLRGGRRDRRRPRRGGRAGRLRHHRSKNRRSRSALRRAFRAGSGWRGRSSTRPSGVRQEPSSSK